MHLTSYDYLDIKTLQKSVPRVSLDLWPSQSFQTSTMVDLSISTPLLSWFKSITFKKVEQIGNKNLYFKLS